MIERAQRHARRVAVHVGGIIDAARSLMGDFPEEEGM